MYTYIWHFLCVYLYMFSHNAWFMTWLIRWPWDLYTFRCLNLFHYWWRSRTQNVTSFGKPYLYYLKCRLYSFCPHLCPFKMKNVNIKMWRDRKHFLYYLNMDLVAQHSSSEDHRFGSSLELFAHMQWLLKCGAPLVHIPRIQNLSTHQSGGKCQIPWQLSQFIISYVYHLAVRVDPCVNEPLQYELGELIFQSCYCGVEGLSHLSHVCWHVGAEILNTQTHNF